MMEYIKTIILSILVTMSLVQSYLLAFSSPQYDQIIPANYVETELIGTQLELEDLIFPKDIVIHLGEERHTLLYPEMIFYKMIMNVVNQRTLGGLQERYDMESPWILKDNEKLGIEIRFAEQIPFEVLQQTMNINNETEEIIENIDTLHIFMNAGQEDVRVLLMNSQSQLGYEATQVDLTAKDAERFVGFSESLIRYNLYQERFYVPLEPVPMMQIIVPYQKFDAEQLQTSLFPDPFNTRNLLERDGSIIYTDGKRGLRFMAGTHWMSYTDPAAIVEQTDSAMNSLFTGIQFINRHGGWNGNYLIVGSNFDEERMNEQRFLFRQYVGSYLGTYPIVEPNRENPFGDIRIMIQNRVITEYERSTIQLQESEIAENESNLVGGDTLIQTLDQYPQISGVENIYPAYSVEILENEVQLNPIWAIEMQDGTIQALLGKE
jgi:regulatory protein YycH of two-component signal transduction system YycFG